MRIKSIELERFRRFTKLKIENLPETAKLVILAGPNGSGKTTFAESYFEKIKGESVFLNPDVIASGIAPLDFEKASFHAGKGLIS